MTDLEICEIVELVPIEDHFSDPELAERIEMLNAIRLQGLLAYALSKYSRIRKPAEA